MIDSDDDRYYQSLFWKQMYDTREGKSWSELQHTAERTTTIVRDLVSSLVANNDSISGEELQTLYHLCQNTGDGKTIDKRRERIRNLDLPYNDINRITDQIKQPMGSVGSAMGDPNLKVGNPTEDDTDEEAKLYDCFERLIDNVDPVDESELLDAVADLVTIDFTRVQSGRMSPILHYLAPEVFPIINRRSREGIKQCFAVDVSNKLVDYLDERESYLAVRDEFGFDSHFRDLDCFFNWIGKDDNPWTTVARQDKKRKYWQAQPGTTKYDYPEVLWPKWQAEGIISMGMDYGPVEQIRSSDSLGTMGRIITEKMSPGDIVVANGGHHDFLGLGVVTPGGYEYRTTPESWIAFENQGQENTHPDVRHVEWILCVDAEDSINIDGWDMRKQFDTKTLQSYNCYYELRYKILENHSENFLSELEELERKSGDLLGISDPTFEDVPPEPEPEPEPPALNRRLVTVNLAKGGMQTQFEESVKNDVDAIEVAQLTDREFDRSGIRLWGTWQQSAESEEVKSGDHVLFFRRDKGYVAVAEVIGTEYLTDQVATEFCDTVWSDADPTDPYDYIIYFGEVYQAEVDLERFFGESVLDFDGHPNDGWTALDKHLNAVADEYGSVEAFIDRAKDEIWYDYWNASKWAINSETTEVVRNQLNRKGQLIFYGPPGTGKTFKARQFTRWWVGCQLRKLPSSFDRIRTVTFHPSFSYEDFIEGYTVADDSKEHIDPSREGDEIELDTQSQSSGHFTLKEGRFRTFCEEAKAAYDKWQDEGARGEQPRYLFLIDEINRGNVAQIFGETITLLERDKRGVSIELAHSGELFEIPPNVYIIGTMNTADQSIALVDAALRRRFASLPVMPEYGVIYDDPQYPIDDRTEALELIQTGRQDSDVLKTASVLGLEIINRKLLEQGGIQKGKRIGHSYLLSSEWDDSKRAENALCDVWRFDILTLLEEYFYGNPEAIIVDIFDSEPETFALFDPSTHDIAMFEPSDLRKELISLVKGNTDLIDTEKI